MKDIWHNPLQTPDVFKSHPIIVVYEAGDQIEQMDSKEYSDLVGERYVNRWCYVDDLIKESERTRKALDFAVDALFDIHKHSYACCNPASEIGYIHAVSYNALEKTCEELKQIKQKEEK